MSANIGITSAGLIPGWFINSDDDITVYANDADRYTFSQLTANHTLILPLFGTISVSLKKLTVTYIAEDSDYYISVYDSINSVELIKLYAGETTEVRYSPANWSIIKRTTIQELDAYLGRGGGYPSTVRATSGALLVNDNYVALNVLQFGGGAYINYADFKVRPPRGFDKDGRLDARIHWTTYGSGSGSVRWYAGATFINDLELLNIDRSGISDYADDSKYGDYYEQLSPWINDITKNSPSTPSSDSLLIFTVKRDPAYDALTDYANLLKVDLRYTINKW